MINEIIIEIHILTRQYVHIGDALHAVDDIDRNVIPVTQMIDKIKGIKQLMVARQKNHSPTHKKTWLHANVMVPSSTAASKILLASCPFDDIANLDSGGLCYYGIFLDFRKNIFG